MAKSKKTYECPICSKKVKARGISPHMRLAHLEDWNDYKDEVYETLPPQDEEEEESAREGKAARTNHSQNGDYKSTFEEIKEGIEDAKNPRELEIATRPIADTYTILDTEELDELDCLVEKKQREMQQEA